MMSKLCSNQQITVPELKSLIKFLRIAFIVFLCNMLFSSKSTFG
ncbi:MAG: hypothetical protein JWQ96_670 [Segetibacter sp.]|nr:hypothetical protein [Segetibacter sp.]